MTDQLVRWRYKQLEANTANIGGLLAKINDAAVDGWELVDLAYADKTLGMNSMHAIVRKALDHPADPDDTTTGWKSDPLDLADERLWNGQVWTVHVRGSRIEQAVEAASQLGPNPTNACKGDEHEKCKRKWCTCACHTEAQVA